MHLETYLTVFNSGIGELLLKNALLNHNITGARISKESFMRKCELSVTNIEPVLDNVL